MLAGSGSYPIRLGREPQHIIFGKIHFLLTSENEFFRNKTWRNYKFAWNSWICLLWEFCHLHLRALIACDVSDALNFCALAFELDGIFSVPQQSLGKVDEWLFLNWYVAGKHTTFQCTCPYMCLIYCHFPMFTILLLCYWPLQWARLQLKILIGL